MGPRVGMVPSDQGLDPDDPLAIEADQWLVVHIELVLVDGDRELPLQREARDEVLVHGRSELLPSVLAGRLRGVHGQVPVTQGVVDIAPILRPA